MRLKKNSNQSSMSRFLKNTLFVFCIVTAFLSCKKTENPISKPILVVTATKGTSGAAGERMDFDIDATAANNLNRITVQVQEGSGPVTMYEDSTIDPSKPHVVFSTQYDLPVEGLKGDEFHFTFTAYDTKGNTATTTKTLTISGSRPKIMIDAPTTDVSAGQTVNFSVTFSDLGADLKNFQWIERINGNTDNLLKDSTFASGVRNVTIPFSYQVPANLTSGQYSVMQFKATNQDNVTWIETKRFTVQ
jgi:hypothetical protein